MSDAALKKAPGLKKQSSPAPTNTTDVSSVNSAPLTHTTISHTSSATSMPSNIAKKETAEERRLRIKKALEDVKKMSQRELRADLEKHGFTVIGKGIPYDTDEDIVYETGGKLL
ncbi:hypothetical protein MferCBS31731_000344 [Microsporum ferrugineum]